MRDRRHVRIGLGAAVALVLVMSACGGDDDAADADAASDLSGTSWNLALVSIEGDDAAAVGAPTLAFGTDGSVAGSTGCNQFAGTYTQDGSDLSIELGPVTLAGCIDPGAAAQEDAILGQLPDVTAFSMQAEQLLLQDSDDETLFTYDAGLTTLEGSSWTATGINNGTGGVETSDATGTVTSDFGADGALSGFGGCNDYNGTYTVSDDGGIAITDVASTRKACDDAAMTVEGRFLAALAEVATYEITGDTLTLRDSSGAAQVTYVLGS
jgi:heat shock protein HslJ